MNLWRDADAAPRDVKEVCYRASERLSLKAILVANTRLKLPVGRAHLRAVRVEGGPDVADRYIAEREVLGLSPRAVEFEVTRCRLERCRKTRLASPPSKNCNE